MKTLYLDCFAGIAGDMFLGALLDLGLDRKTFLETMESIVLFPGHGHSSGHGHGVEHSHDHDHDHDHHHHHAPGEKDRLKISISKGSRGGIAGTKVSVHNLEDHPHRGLSDVLAIIEASPLSPRVKERSAAAFRLLAEAEAKVHGTTPEEVHFHEVGAIDSIADIIGAFVLVEMAGIEKTVSSPLNVGSGTIKCAHGILPVPAPAAMELLEGIPVYAEGAPMERVTPTGALLVRCLAGEFGPLPSGKVLASGKGLGDRDSDIPNLVRAVIVDTPDHCGRDAFRRDRGVVLETNIDDMNPQYYGPVMQKLFAEGALDVWATPMIMKKGRPAVTLSCLCLPEMEEVLAEILLRETTTLGLRKYPVDRLKTDHEIVERETSWGLVRFKVARLGGETLRANPEFEDVRRLSEEHSIPLPEMRERLVGEFLP
ncbi:MAG: nickel pincer cofactor biosynthesis protein LarC [Synergistales bacterium]|nr:nickel pincer cofactor biosynthesis protein LarC [Synergistales bacterium]